jgi:hypothetical protein
VHYGLERNTLDNSTGVELKRKKGRKKEKEKKTGGKGKGKERKGLPKRVYRGRKT